MTELTAVSSPAQELRARVEAVLKADDELATEFFGGFDHPCAFFGTACQRLFAQHITTRFERADRTFGVQFVRRTNADRIELLLGKHLAPVFEGSRHAELRRMTRHRCFV